MKAYLGNNMATNNQKTKAVNQLNSDEEKK